jgi:type IV secretory pathway component VirB8
MFFKNIDSLPAVEWQKRQILFFISAAKSDKWNADKNFLHITHRFILFYLISIFSIINLIASSSGIGFAK